MILSRKAWGWVVLGVCAMGWAGVTPAWAKKEKSPSKKSDSKEAPAADAKRQAQQKALEALNGTQWAVELAPMGAKEKQVVKDQLRFEGGKVSSEKLAGEGFPATNCTVTVGEDGVTIWETMQTGQDSSVAFWRGELHGETLRGILSQHSADGAVVRDWAFSGKLGAPAAEQTAPAAKIAAQPAAAPTSAAKKK